MSSDRMNAAIRAKAAVDELDEKYRLALRREASASAALRDSVRECNELKERLYGHPARQIASFYTAEWEKRPDLMAYTICLRPKQMQYCLSNLQLIDSYSSMRVIGEAIEKVTEAVKKDLADQLKSQAWEVAQARGRC